MTEPPLETSVGALIRDGKLAEAEETLLRVQAEAAKTADTEQLLVVLDLLAITYLLQQPKQIAKADQALLAREQLRNDARNKLNTAMTRYYGANDYPGAVAKAEEAITDARREHDDSTLYSALSLLGLGLLQIGDDRRAADLIDQIERMIDERRTIIVGDETSFLERARSRGVNVAAIARIAAKLAPVCRDPAFAARLNALTDRE